MAPRGAPQLRVMFNLDANGIVTCHAKDERSGKSASIKVQSSGGLTNEEIERMTKDAELSKQQDLARNRVIELKNKADQFIYNTESQLTEHKDALSSEVAESVRKDISNLNEAIVSENEDKIKDALEKLNKSA